MDIATKCFYQNKRLIWQFPVKESTECRKVDGFTRKKLAAKIGTSGPIVGRYESGDMMPSIEIKSRIAEALEVSLDFLVGNSSILVKDKTSSTALKISQSFLLRNKVNSLMSLMLIYEIIKQERRIVSKVY
ncbi:MAG: helix-turn-helix transcriptional regulator [Saprospiraceae bacterium]|nr:helix-turn-helix transcriptional regulator [Saprospiraceae bacterium]